jgi:hypothetical protein
MRWRARYGVRVFFANVVLPGLIIVATPDGCLAVGATFGPKIDPELLAGQAGRMGLSFASGLTYKPPGQRLNCTQRRVASSAEAELTQSVLILRKLLHPSL